MFQEENDQSCITRPGFLQGNVRGALDLSIGDGLKGTSCSPALAKARAVVRILGRPGIDIIVKGGAGLSTLLDAETRWKSSRQMLNRLLQLRTVVDDLAAVSPELHMSDAE